MGGGRGKPIRLFNLASFHFFFKCSNFCPTEHPTEELIFNKLAIWRIGGKLIFAEWLTQSFSNSNQRHQHGPLRHRVLGPVLGAGPVSLGWRSRNLYPDTLVMLRCWSRNHILRTTGIEEVLCGS